MRKFARELGVPLEEVKGTGPKGRITQEDVQGFTKAVMSGRGAAPRPRRPRRRPAAAAARPWACCPGPRSTSPSSARSSARTLSRIKKISGANLHRNWVMIPHVTNHDDADITELEAFRVQLNKENEKSGVKVTMLAFLIKACVAALKKFPEFNSSLDGEQLVLKQYFHIGFAADTPNGLVVPVIKDADKKGVLQISQEMGELAKKARDGKLGPADMSGACFTISSLGGIGGRYFTPIINAPEVAILGVCKSQIEPVWDGKQFQPRLMLPLSLSWDHRVIDGASAARFNAYLGADPGGLPPRCLLVRTQNRARMTTVVVVKKAGQIAIAADTLVTFGDTRLATGSRTTPRSSRSRPTTARATSAWPARWRTSRCCARRWARCRARSCKLGSKDEVFDTFTKLHPYLKDNFFLQTKEEDSDPYESSQFSVVIANASGIYGLYSYREVFEFKEFWGIGSGRSFALGAMHAVYAKAKTAKRSGRSRHRRRLRVRPQFGRALPTSSQSKMKEGQK